MTKEKRRLTAHRSFGRNETIESGSGPLYKTNDFTWERKKFLPLGNVVYEDIRRI